VKILLVEDSKFLRMATERALRAAGYEVISASDGEQALRLAREHVPALILLDVMLPMMSGPDVMKFLKNDPTTAAIPVMMLTGLSQKNAKQLEKDGASGFFEKSDSMLGNGPESLLASVDQLLKKTKASQ
jgi:two-component system cell cycle response regulator DivK